MKACIFHKNIRYTEVSKFDRIVGLIIGVAFAIILYAFLQLSGQIMRMFSTTPDFELWVMPNKVQQFFNLILAFISVIFGQSICIAYWFNKPKRVSGKLNYRKISIVNDQRFFSWNFLHWFVKLGYVLLMIFLDVFKNGYFYFQLYPSYNYLFILIIIVLHFQSWNAIFLNFKRKSYKWFLLSTIIITILSFGISKINFYDYDEVNASIQKNNVYEHYILELPKSEMFNKIVKRSLTEQLYVVYDKNDLKNTSPIIIADRKVVDLNGLSEKIDYWMSVRNKFDRRYLTIKLNIHKDVKMGFVNKLTTALSKSNVNKVAYSVSPSHTTFDGNAYRNFVLPKYLPLFKFELNDSEHYKKLINKSGLTVKCIDNKTYMLNNEEVSHSSLKSAFKKYFFDTKQSLIIFEVEDNLNYSDYIFMLSSLRKAYQEFKSEYITSKYSKKFYELSDEERKEFYDNFRVLHFELTSDIKKIIDQKE